jgi:hypothetical protein
MPTLLSGLTELEEAILRAKQLAGAAHPKTYRALAQALSEAEAETVHGVVAYMQPRLHWADRLIPRWCHRLFAAALSFFWISCRGCGRGFGGHQWRVQRYGDRQMVYELPRTACAFCPRCAVEGHI